MTSIQLHNLRLSVIWVETRLDLLGDQDPDPQVVPFAFLGRKNQYESMFNKIVQRESDTHDLRLPWKRRREHFWESYLKVKGLHTVTAERAWKNLVPLRRLMPIEVQADWLPGTITVQGFFYPHGIALLFKTSIYTHPNSGFSLPKVLEISHNIKHDQQFHVRTGNGEVQHLPLDSLAEQCLDQLHLQAFGSLPEPGPRPEPFTIWTVVGGDASDKAELDPKHPEVHRALNAVTEWHANYRTSNLQDFNSAQIKTCAPANDRVLYSARRGRAVWFADSFPQSQEENGRWAKKLACYHHNLVFTSMQIESLGGLITTTAEQLRQGQTIPDPQNYCARRAVGGLSRLFGAIDKTYRTRSACKQIVQNKLIDDTNEVRILLAVDPEEAKKLDAVDCV